MKNGNAARWFLAGTAVILLLGLTTDQIMNNVYDSSSTALRANIVNASGTPVAFSIVQGSTAIANGTDKHCLFQDGTVVGEDAGCQFTKATGTLAATILGATSDGTVSAPSVNVGTVGGFWGDSSGGNFVLNHNLADTSFGVGWDITRFGATGNAEMDLFTANGNLAFTVNGTTGNAGISPGNKDLTLSSDHLYVAGEPNVTINKHLVSTLNAGAAVTPNTCGTGAAVTSGSTDMAGWITVGSTPPATCTVNFGGAFGSAPVCLCNNETSVARPCTVTAQSTTVLTMTESTPTQSDVLKWICIGK